MKNPIQLVVFLSIVVFQYACIPSYIPNSRNIPLLEEKGNFNVAAGVGRGGLEVQSSVALTDHLGLIASGTYLDSRVYNNDSPFLKNNNAEIGIGYFTKTEKFIAEIYGGYGIGYFEERTPNDQATRENLFINQYQRYFLSPIIGWKWDDFDMGLTFRTSFIRENFREVTYPPNRRNFVFEPAVVVRYKVRQFNYFLQFGLNGNVIPANSYLYGPHIFTISTGFGYRISHLFGK